MARNWLVHSWSNHNTGQRSGSRHQLDIDRASLWSYDADPLSNPIPISNETRANMRLEGKIALITGAASGIGEATAELFAAEGASVVVSDVNEAAAKTVAQRIQAAGGEATAITGSVADRATAERIVSESVERYGRVDILVNSAGVTRRHAPEGADFEEQWEFVMSINMKGTMLMCKFASDEMKKSGGGAIVNLASVYGIVGRPASLGDGFDPYTQSKGGVVQLTREMGVAMAKQGIRTNCLCPGFVYTNLTTALSENPETLATMEALHPIGRLGQPIEIANAALFLASDDASFVTGAVLSVDGGYSAQ